MCLKIIEVVINKIKNSETKVYFSLDM